MGTLNLTSELDKDNALFLIRICQALYLPDDAWKLEPTVAQLSELHRFGNDDDDTHGVVGSIDGATILAFRGTGPISTQNWLADFAAVPEVRTDYGPGLVHTGFANLMDHLWPAIFGCLKDTAPKLVIAGHSLGGALASLAAVYLSRKPSPPEILCTYFFGAPRVGNAAYALQPQSPLYRIVNGRDVVGPVWKLFGSLKNVARLLLESVRFLHWEAEWFDPRKAGKLRIQLDSS